ncbi:MAG TPA: aconitate hydratase AcnA [Flavobacteriaceae bacterium]|nr:aconitate hydratase AcnA [Flavobacteriaceae bacterium]
MSKDPFQVKQTLKLGDKQLEYFSLAELEKQGYEIDKLPFSIRIMLENALRNYDDFAVTKEHIETLLNWKPDTENEDIPYKPARILMQDFTGVPSVVDIAALRSEVARKGGDPDKINPLVPVDLVIDHSVQVDYYAADYAYEKNIQEEYKRNIERYTFLKWAQKAFDNFSVVPPGMGICHQVNLEYLAQAVIERDGQLFPDTLVGTDSHTPMVNGIGVVGWGVGGIEAEAALLGQPIYIIMPQVVGLKLTGKMPVGTTATDMVLNIAEALRKHGVVGDFVEVFGDGLDHLTVPDRATVSNMSPEFGCTITLFPVDDKTLEYMEMTNRSAEVVERVEAYSKANKLWRENTDKIEYSSVVELDLSKIEPSVAGPKRPQDKILMRNLKTKFKDLLKEEFDRDYVEQGDRMYIDSLSRWGYEGGNRTVPKPEQETAVTIEEDDKNMRSLWIHDGHEKYELSDGSIAVAAITSCTNTSNPYVMIGAGLVAQKAREKGIDSAPWVKTSLAPGSKVVTDYLQSADLMRDLEALGFHLVGYGCTTCIGNTGPLPQKIEEAIDKYDLVVSSVLSGNRNFEARIHPKVRMNFLMSPMLVVAYAIAGRVDINLAEEPLTYDKNHQPIYLKDIWPSNEEINEIMSDVLTPGDFDKNYGEIFAGNEIWRNLDVPEGKIYEWDEESTYIKEFPLFRDISEEPSALEDIKGARVLVKLGDSITTDHISPAGRFSKFSAAGQYLVSKGVEPQNFNSYGSRRGNDEVMVRGTFANVRIKNQLVDKEGGYTIHIPSGEEMTVFDAAQKYKEDNTPLVVLTGKEYGSGSSRDWAAKGTYLLGIKAVIAESYERIHRSNLMDLGVMPLQYKDGETADSLGLTGKETFDIIGIAEGLKPHKEVDVIATDENGKKTEFKAIVRLDSEIEIEYYRNDGILQYVLREFLKDAN